jgi:hypothetical protein
MNLLPRLERLFIWLSGASHEALAKCPAWERRKYVAFGATVLVPCSFGIIASAYALSTLTDDWRVIAPVALVWAGIILTVDRALLAIYRSYQPFLRKLSQFFLRLVVAGLMGVTISHPLTLLLFRDTISAEVEKNRQGEIEAVRKLATEQKGLVEVRLKDLEKEIATQRQNWNETFQAKFLENGQEPAKKPLTPEEEKVQAARQQKVAEASAAQREKLAATEQEIASNSASAQKVASELEHWQAEFEREINGQRSGIRGIGPRAKSIQDDHLAWRRVESKRLGEVLESLTGQKNAPQQEIVSAEAAVNAALDAEAAAAAAKDRAEALRVQGLKEQVQQQQADAFVVQQNAIRETLKKHIDSLLLNQTGLHGEIAKLTADETERIQKLKDEPRKDILTQTLALHALFKRGAEGGQFALTAYWVLTLLFMLVDTIPLIVKFFAKPGPYDTLVDCDEVKFSSEREAYLASYGKYMKQLSSGRLLHLTRNQPLEAALIEGVDRSRVAKEFLESLLELEKSFETRIAEEKRKLAEAPSTSGKSAVLEAMAENFYADLKQRMEAFFADRRTA